MWSEPSSGIKLTAYSCTCWLFHRIYYDARNQKHLLQDFVLLVATFHFYPLCTRAQIMDGAWGSCLLFARSNPFSPARRMSMKFGMVCSQTTSSNECDFGVLAGQL